MTKLLRDAALAIVTVWTAIAVSYAVGYYGIPLFVRWTLILVTPS